jgi:hypothetical protein
MNVNWIVLPRDVRRLLSRCTRDAGVGSPSKHRMPPDKLFFVQNWLQVIVYFKHKCGSPGVTPFKLLKAKSVVTRR